MRSLTTQELLQVWEEGRNEPLLNKTLRLLSKAHDVDDPEQLGKLSIGERDARLLRLREWMFGNKLKNVSVCPLCNETIEWQTDTKDLHLHEIKNDLSVNTFYLQQDGLTIHYRLPDSYDLSAFTDDVSSTKINSLLTSCIIEITDSNEVKQSADVLPEAAWQALEQSMSEQDPQADINMKATCPNCNHAWEAVFDIVSFLWAEINNWAKHILQEVALLARAFSWSEKDILSMSPQRRQLYLEMLYK